MNILCLTGKFGMHKSMPIEGNMKRRSRTEYSLLNIVAGVGGYIINTILGFVCRMVFVQCLAADYLGVNGLFTNILSMLSLAELGIGGAIVYALYKPLAENNEKKIASLVKVYGTAYKIIGITVGVVGMFLMPFLDIIIREQPNISESIYVLYLLNLFNTVITYFFSYRSSLLIAAQQNYIVVGINYTVTILQSIFQMIVLVLTHNYMAYILIQTVGTIIYNLVVSRAAVIRFPCIADKNVEPLPQNEKKALFKNIRDLTFYKVSGLLVNSTDNILITFFQGLATTGVASNYTLLVNTLNSLLGQVFNSLTASIGNHNATESEDRKFKMFNFMNLMNFWIFGWAALGIVFCSSDLVRLCFGEEYVLPLRIPFVLALNFYTVGMMNAVWTYKHTLGLFRYGRFLQIITGILNIIFSVILGRSWGLFGILFATFIARACTNLWYDPYAIFKHGFHKRPLHYLKKYIYFIVVLLVAAIACYFSLKLVCGSLIVRVLLEVLICSVVTNVVFFCAFCKTAEFSILKEVLTNVCSILRKR